MALDFYRLENTEFLFCLTESQLEYLAAIFTTFTEWTGRVIDPYGDFQLTIENQSTLVKIIDKYVEHTDLNKDKKQTVSILEFRGLMVYCINNRIDLRGLGD